MKPAAAMNQKDRVNKAQRVKENSKYTIIYVIRTTEKKPNLQITK